MWDPCVSCLFFLYLLFSPLALSSSSPLARLPPPADGHLHRPSRAKTRSMTGMKVARRSSRSTGAHAAGIRVPWPGACPQGSPPAALKERAATSRPRSTGRHQPRHGQGLRPRAMATSSCSGRPPRFACLRPGGRRAAGDAHYPSSTLSREPIPTHPIRVLSRHCRASALRPGPRRLHLLGTTAAFSAS